MDSLGTVLVRTYVFMFVVAAAVPRVRAYVRHVRGGSIRARR